MIVVIPSNRNIDLDYLGPLIEEGARFIVVDDSEGNITTKHPQFAVYNWGDRRRILGELDPYFPRKNGACRSFGFYMAWKESDDDEILVALDDDCRVYHHDFPARVAAVLTDEPRPVARTAGMHLNILDLYDGAPDHLFPRGFPYSARLGYERAVVAGTESRPVKFSLGLWKRTFDVNAVDKIAGPSYVFPDIELAHESVIVPEGSLISVCSMNMHFRREVIPAAYQLPMHVEVIPGGVIDRYGDIWGGFILKLLMDLKGDAMALGEPMIDHLKEGNFERNLWGENLCHQVNDEFIDLIGEGAANVKPASYVEMMGGLGEELARLAPGCSPLLRAYLGTLVPSVAAWVTALS